MMKFHAIDQGLVSEHANRRIEAYSQANVKRVYQENACSLKELLDLRHIKRHLIAIRMVKNFYASLSGYIEAVIQAKRNPIKY